MSVCPGVRVEDPDIKKCPFKSTTPESTSRDVGACTILSVGRYICKCFITVTLTMCRPDENILTSLNTCVVHIHGIECE